MTRVVITLLFAGLAGAADWPGFRGPIGQGVSPDKPPVKWSATENVVWKVPVPGESWSSPIVRGDRVYLTTATDGGRSGRVLAFDVGSGKVHWDREAHRQELKRIEGRNSHATPTPATDGERVYAAFNDGAVVAVSAADGSPVWTNTDFPFYSQHGLGTSPLLYKDLVIVAFDGSSPGPDKLVGWQKPWDKAVVVAFEAATGKVRWKAGRGQSRIGHATSVVVRDGDRDVLVSIAGDVIQGFDPATGTLAWTVKTVGEGLVPSPVAGDGLVFCASGFGKPTLRAVRLGGAGDVTKSHVAWENTRVVPMIPSPVYANGRLFVVTDKLAACLDANSGKVVWDERLPGSYSASAVLAGGNVYALSDAGLTTVFKAADKFELVGRNDLGEPAQATPAVAGDRLFIRTKSQLWCVGVK